MTLDDPRKRKDEVNRTENEHSREVDTQLERVGRIRLRNKGIHERYEVNIKANLVAAFQKLETVTAKVQEEGNADWTELNLPIHQDICSVRKEFEKARTAALDALREISDKSQEACYEEEKIKLLSVKYNKYVKVLATELETVHKLEDRRWEDTTAARQTLTWWNKEVIRLERQLNSIGWFWRLIMSTRELRRQIKIGRGSEARSSREHERNSWQYLYMRGLRVREEEVLASIRERITLIGKAWEEACADENALINLKMGLTEICSDISRLEVYVIKPSIAFGRLDFLKCVLQLLESESMSRVGAYTDIQNAKRAITSLCGEGLESEWDGSIYDLDDIDDEDLNGSVSKVGAVGNIEDALSIQVTGNSWIRDVQTSCTCPLCR